ncbi:MULTISPECIES: hypothetical protein [unclassified Paraburkholderia]|uniref:hypothetical protein n=1 Tax=unclassified Paraburkholderia TaxID=2615204 RepID=UPI0020B76B7E|nr:MULTISPECIES: hypothetical protein [unclassified Paraburkholderia]MCP3718936.1 hypothetical protein [Paraburkholderia sp. CNPSo 3281]MCX5543363.1 hypothetical protein [Paraburkholderia sp. CNPSo 3076]
MQFAQAMRPSLDHLIANLGEEIAQAHLSGVRLPPVAGELSAVMDTYRASMSSRLH